jgi:hypothetical protein
MTTCNASRDGGNAPLPLTDAERIALRGLVAFLDDSIRDMVRFAKTADDVDVQVSRLRAMATLMRALENGELIVDDDVVVVVTDNHSTLLDMIGEHQDELRRLVARDPDIVGPGESFESNEASAREELDGLLDEYTGSRSILSRAGVA